MPKVKSAKSNKKAKNGKKESLEIDLEKLKKILESKRNFEEEKSDAENFAPVFFKPSIKSSAPVLERVASENEPTNLENEIISTPTPRNENERESTLKYSANNKDYSANQDKQRQYSSEINSVRISENKPNIKRRELSFQKIDSSRTKQRWTDFTPQLAEISENRENNREYFSAKSEDRFEMQREELPFEQQNKKYDRFR